MSNVFHQFAGNSLRDYEFTQAELDAFLSQPVPREVPDALRSQTQSTTGDLIGFISTAGAIVFAPLIVGPLFAQEELGVFAFLLSAVGLVISVLIVWRLLKWSRSLPTLVRDGILVTGRFDEVEFKHDDIGGTWYATLKYEVEESTIHETRQLPNGHGDLAAWLCDTQADVPILYARSAPRHCRWAGEFLYPCPDPPDHDNEDPRVG